VLKVMQKEEFSFYFEIKSQNLTGETEEKCKESQIKLPISSPKIEHMLQNTKARMLLHCSVPCLVLLIFCTVT
jgi:hypothetical protein